MRTTYTVKASEIERKWYVVDATGHTLGRLASEVARILRGKHKPIFTPHLDTGDFVIIINADKINVTGKKLLQKKYYRHSDYVGSLKEVSLKDMLDKKPTEVLRHAIKGMLPKNPLGRQMFTKIRIYSGPEHEQQAQQPEVLEIKY
ncbi:MAG: 50S ribosomal protein L13 [Clostridiales bacterium]|jgi:large subunit ribosomal protein L13|nr:50S ribosomal protein L13 [Clostridiales bacterium]